MKQQPGKRRQPLFTAAKVSITRCEKPVQSRQKTQDFQLHSSTTESGHQTHHHRETANLTNTPVAQLVWQCVREGTGPKSRRDTSSLLITETRAARLLTRPPARSPRASLGESLDSNLLMVRRSPGRPVGVVQVAGRPQQPAVRARAPAPHHRADPAPRRAMEELPEISPDSPPLPLPPPLRSYIFT